MGSWGDSSLECPSAWISAWSARHRALRFWLLAVLSLSLGWRGVRGVLGCFRFFLPMSIRTTSGWGWTVSQEFAPDYIVPVGNSEVVFMVLAQDPPDNLQPPYKVNVMMVPSKTEQGLPFYLLLAAIYSLMIRRLKDLKTLKDFKMLKYLML